MAEVCQIISAQMVGGIGLQNRCTTTVLSRRTSDFPRDCLLPGQRRKRDLRGWYRFAVAHVAAQSVPPPFTLKNDPTQAGRRGQGLPMNAWECAHGL